MDNQSKSHFEKEAVKPELKMDEVLNDLRWAIMKLSQWAINKGSGPTERECDRINEKYNLRIH